jgi:2,3-bisphosphoglycerate-independent phosphoglycerate mutase
MLDAGGQPNRFATANAVPLHIVGEDLTHLQLKKGGSLSDIAPTILGILGVEKPGNMTGSDLRITH